MIPSTRRLKIPRNPIEKTLNLKKPHSLLLGTAHPLRLVLVLLIEFIVVVLTTGLVFALFGQFQISLPQPWGNLAMILPVFPLSGLVWIYHRFRTGLSPADVGFTVRGRRLALLPLGIALALLLSTIALFLKSFLAPAVQISTRFSGVTPLE